MPEKLSTLAHPKFWDFMKENSKAVAQMPVWMKGSPVNQRTPSPEPEQKICTTTKTDK